MPLKNFTCYYHCFCCLRVFSSFFTAITLFFCSALRFYVRFLCTVSNWTANSLTRFVQNENIEQKNYFLSKTVSSPTVFEMVQIEQEKIFRGRMRIKNVGTHKHTEMTEKNCPKMRRFMLKCVIIICNGFTTI